MILQIASASKKDINRTNEARFPYLRSTVCCKNSAVADTINIAQISWEGLKMLKSHICIFHPQKNLICPVHSRMSLFRYWETNILLGFDMDRKRQSRNILSCDNYCQNQRVLPVSTHLLPGHCSPSSSIVLYLWEPEQNPAICIWSRSRMRLLSSGVRDHHFPAKPGKLIYIADGWRC